ncbi:hypothetical protein [Micromonospora sp. NPDC126480]|uniref:hypothetical protein n=1 Tax=Micromonospora sp. NPDC126480 TaxID=3155312 RepID=UPI00331C305D
MVHLLMWIHSAHLAFTADQWSAFGSILGGLGSILAVIGAASLLTVEVHGRRVEARRYAQERREFAAEQRERETRQRDSDASLARLVIAETGDFTSAVEGGEDEADLHISVQNHSNSFVFDVVVRIPGTPIRRLIHFIKPGGSEDAEFRSLPYDYHIMHISCGGPYTPNQLRVTLEFTDPSGRRWRRVGWDYPLRLPDELANPDLYRYVPPFKVPHHPYDETLERLGLQMIEGAE